MTAIETRSNWSLYWWVPAAPVLLHLGVLLLMAMSGSKFLGFRISDVYQVMFFLSPLVGIGVLLSSLVVLVIQRPLLKEIKVVRTIVCALVAIVSPPVMFVLGIVLSGFTR